MNVLLVQNYKLCCLRNLPLEFKKGEIEGYDKDFQNSYAIEDELSLSKYL